MKTGLAVGLRKRGGLGLRQTLGVWSSGSEREEHFLRSLDLGARTVYDVGGFEGIHTIFFADRVGALGHVVTFEPHPQNYERVLTNVRLNRLSNVTVLKTAVGRARGELDFVYPADDRGVGSADEDVRRVLLAHRAGAAVLRLPVTTLDEELQERQLPAPDLVKIDVEGLEYDVLLGMRHIIREHRPDFFIELHGVNPVAKARNADRVVGLLSEHGYDVYHVESEKWLASVDSLPIEGHVFATLRSTT